MDYLLWHMKLKRGRHINIKWKVTHKAKRELLLCFSFQVTTIHGYHAMAFLSDPSTVEFIRNSHTMFIMRGLPGSGKSTLVRCLQQTYPRAVVCSADHYFLDREGNYKYCYYSAILLYDLIKQLLNLLLVFSQFCSESV